jgi:hypothetical protein
MTPDRTRADAGEYAAPRTSDVLRRFSSHGPYLTAHLDGEGSGRAASVASEASSVTIVPTRERSSSPDHWHARLGQSHGAASAVSSEAQPSPQHPDGQSRHQPFQNTLASAECTGRASSPSLPSQNTESGSPDLFASSRGGCGPVRWSRPSRPESETS